MVVNGLSKARLIKAKSQWESAKLLLENNHLEGALSRSYYAMFTTARALLATKDLDSKKHVGIISLFNQHFVKAEIVSKKWGKALALARSYREESDYADYVCLSLEEVEDQILQTQCFIEEVEKVLKK